MRLIHGTGLRGLNNCAASLLFALAGGALGCTGELGDAATLGASMSPGNNPPYTGSKPVSTEVAPPNDVMPPADCNQSAGRFVASNVMRRLSPDQYN
ncbi:MAG: hypothetical protein RJA70_1041, partial [Pseudomonadota bacterium]